MKKVIKENELREKMNEAIDLLCDTVKHTLGPKGNNVIIDHSLFRPFITNDGVTIAENIESEDEIVNTILELAKEASIKTNEFVGDGTTTTLVLLQSLYHEGVKQVKNNISPLTIKKDLAQSLEIIISKLQKEAWKITKNDVIKIATNGGGSQEIGKLISEAYQKVKDKNKIRIKEGKFKTELQYKKGYIMESIISPYFFTKSKRINLNNPYLMVVNDDLNDLEEIASMLNFAVESQKSIVLIAKEFSEEFQNNLLSLYLEENLNVYLLKVPGYGSEKIEILKDLLELSNSSLSKTGQLIVDNQTVINTITLTEEETIIAFEMNEKLNKNERLKKLGKGLAEIEVGAITDTERRELKMRFDDALEAVASSQNGVVLGSGIPLYKISEELEFENTATPILKEALKAPLKQILMNAGLQKEIIEQIKKENYEIVYNLKTLQYEEKQQTNVIDPLDVVISSLKNAVSITGMLLTTTSLVINESNTQNYKNENMNEL